MRVLVLGSLVPQTARTVWNLLAGGHQIEEIWVGENSNGPWNRRDRRLRWVAPTWSVEAAVRYCGAPLRWVGPLLGDPPLVANGCRPHVDALLASCFPHRVPKPMLEYYHGRACNLHPAMLPRYRGPRPMTAIAWDEAFDASGMTLHLMSTKFDEGAVIAQQPVPWPADGWFRTWEADLADAAGRLAADALSTYLKGRLAATHQLGRSNYARSMPAGALTIDRRIDQRRARWLAESLGRVLPLSVPTAKGPIAVGPLLAIKGFARGEAPKALLRSVECDVADARISLRKWDRLHRQVERVRELASLAKRPLQRVA